jgi:hypothetical protein
MHLCMMASARNNTEGVVENIGPEDQAGTPSGEDQASQDDMVGVDGFKMNNFRLTCMYSGCSYEAPTDATEEEALVWLQMHSRARHQQARVQQQHQQQELVENKLVGEPVVNKPGDNFMNKKAVWSSGSRVGWWRTPWTR